MAVQESKRLANSLTPTQLQPPAQIPGLRTILLCALPVLLFVQAAIWTACVPPATHGRAAFRCFYSAGYMVNSGHSAQLYDYRAQRSVQESVTDLPGALPFIHPAYEALIFAPLAALKFKTAYFVFLFVNFLLLAAALYLVSRMIQDRVSLFLLAAGFMPLSYALVWGQDSMIFLFLLSLATLLLSREGDLAAGLMLGLALFRFQHVIPIALLFLVWKRWRFVAGFALSSTVVLSVSLAMVGWEQIKIYIQELLVMSLGSHDFAYAVEYGQKISWMPNIRGFIITIAGNSAWSQAAVFFLSGAAMLFAAVRRPANGLQAITLAIPTAMLASYHLYVHDISQLLVPVALVMLGGVTVPARSCYAALMAFVAPLLGIPPSRMFLAAVPLALFAVFIRFQDRAAIRRTAPTASR